MAFVAAGAVVAQVLGAFAGWPLVLCGSAEPVCGFEALSLGEPRQIPKDSPFENTNIAILRRPCVSVMLIKHR
jgi:hypothetical protein